MQQGFWKCSGRPETFKAFVVDDLLAGSSDDHPTVTSTHASRWNDGRVGAEPIPRLAKRGLDRPPSIVRVFGWLPEETEPNVVNYGVGPEHAALNLGAREPQKDRSQILRCRCQ
jgi:hypothetical protein